MLCGELGSVDWFDGIHGLVAHPQTARRWQSTTRWFRGVWLCRVMGRRRRRFQLPGLVRAPPCITKSRMIEMPVLPDPIANLVAALSKLPGIGPRSAERIALHLVQTDSAVVKLLADAILQARE